MRNFLFIIPRIFAIKLIRFYQKIFSLDHGWLKFLKPYGQCRFYPSCSEYTCQAIEKYGLIKGGIKAMWRLLRCNPFNEGGHDPLN
ncbi:MAG: membrane protein insertion efficiency factor YidD [Patescibacteria group bacterium]